MPKKEQTGIQMVGVSRLTDPQLPKKLARKYAKWRQMRRDPTIALARQLCIAPVLAAPWSVEHTEDAFDGAVDMVQASMMPLRTHIVRTGLLGCVDFGWQGYEKLFAIDDSGQVYLRKLKPLLQDYTYILVEEDTGAYAGLRQTLPQELDLKTDETLLLNIDVEGTDWYGQSLMEIAEDPYDRWEDVDDAAGRYDKKIAGTHWVVHYPAGTSNYDGVEKDNYEIARDLLQALESSGGIVVPRQLERITDDLNRDVPDAWKIELITDSGAGSTAYENRQKYLDALKVRAFGLPERAILEGQFGTKAEAEAHADLAILNMELRHAVLCQQVNWHAVNQLLRLNYGKGTDDSVYIEPAPIADLALQFLRQLFTTITTQPDGLMQILDGVDMEALYDRLGIPIIPATQPDQPGRTPQTRPAEELEDEDLIPFEDLA